MFISLIYGLQLKFIPEEQCNHSRFRHLTMLAWIQPEQYRTSTVVQHSRSTNLSRSLGIHWFYLRCYLSAASLLGKQCEMSLKTCHVISRKAVCECVIPFSANHVHCFDSACPVLSNSQRLERAKVFKVGLHVQQGILVNVAMAVWATIFKTESKEICLNDATFICQQTMFHLTTQFVNSLQNGNIHATVDWALNRTGLWNTHFDVKRSVR